MRRYYPADPDSRADYSAAICVAFDGTTPCSTDDVPAWATQTDLAAPVGVRQGTVVAYAAALTGTQSEAGFRQKVAGHIVVQGPTATFPVIAHIDTTARGYRSGGLNQSTGTTTFSMTLPAGATCTSRSGQAFDGLCPLAQ